MFFLNLHLDLSLAGNPPYRSIIFPFCVEPFLFVCVSVVSESGPRLPRTTSSNKLCNPLLYPLINIFPMNDAKN